MVCSPEIFFRLIEVVFCFSSSSFGPPSKKRKHVDLNGNDQGGEDSLLKKQLNNDVDC